MVNPLPSNANIGPGQAPRSAQPKPNIDPPIIYRFTCDGSFGGMVIGFPLASFMFFRFMICTEMMPTIIARPIIPYIWKSWKRNISWILNQDTTSDFTNTKPKAVPINKYFKYSENFMFVCLLRTCQRSRLWRDPDSVRFRLTPRGTHC